MKKWLLVGSIILVLFVAGAAGCSKAGTPPMVSLAGNQQQGIWVNGQGKVAVSPDIAVITLGVQAQEATVAVAQAQATEAMTRVVAALTGNGVADRDVQTQRFSVQVVTRYDQTNQRDEIIGYQVTNVVTARIRALDTTGVIIDAAAVAGGDLTRIEALTFSIEDPTIYQTQARQAALLDAKTKADQMADLSGVKLGSPVFISESVSQPSAIPIKSGSSGGTPISPGELNITVTVQVVYEIS